MEKQEQTIRQSNFELLRILAMFLITLHHFLIYRSVGHLETLPTDSFNKTLLFMVSSGGKIGVLIFILLTGYFASKKEFNLKKIIIIYLKTMFYSLVIFLVARLFGNPEIYKNIKFYLWLFPLGKSVYWFITVWIVLMIFSPVLNYTLQNAKPENLRKYLIFSTIIWVILPHFGLNYYSNRLVLFAYLYVLAGCIRLGYIKFDKRKLNWLTLITVIYTAIKLFSKINKYGSEFDTGFYYGKMFEFDRFFIIIVSLWLFQTFSSLKIQNKFINYIAGSMFSVYLLQENSFVKKLFGKKDFLFIDNINYFYIFKAFIISIIVFIIFIIIDKILYRLYTPIINKISDYLVIKITK